MDTIDLTLSSPEPEPQPRVTPRQLQPEPATYFKKEPHSSNMTRVQDERYQWRISAQNAQTEHQTHRSNQGNITEIVNSSDPAMLKKVLLELCQMSPALCGAVTRGLASHSKVAHGKDRERDSGRKPGVWQTPRYGSQNAFERTAQNSAARNGTYLGESSGIHASQPLYWEKDRITRTPGTSFSGSRVKREYRLEPTSSESEEDGLHVPGSFPRSTHRTSFVRPAQDASHSSSASNRVSKPVSLSDRLATIKQEKSAALKRCSKCRELFLNEDDMCMYHPGRRIDREDGEVIWSCCSGLAKDLGCEFGKHVDPDSRFKRPSVSPSSDWINSKKTKFA